MSLLSISGVPRAVRESIFTATSYFMSAATALLLTRFDGGLAIMWWAGAILFARLITTPRRYWVPLCLSCVPAGVAAAQFFGFGHGVAIPLALISVAEPLGAAWLLKKMCPRIGRFETVEEVLGFVFVAGILAPGASASVAALCVGLVGHALAWPMWRDWYAGHALGLLVCGPPLALRLRGEIRRWISSAGRRGTAEAIWLLAAIIAATGATFGQSRMPLVMLPVVPMMLATFRLGRIGAVASIVTLVVIGTGCSLAGSGPTTLLHGAMAFRLQVLQIYFACVALILLPIAAELKTRRRLLDRLRASEALQRLVLESSGDVVLGLGRDDRVRYASPQSEGAWGYTPAALIGRPSQDFIHPLDRERVREAAARALAEPEVAVVVEYRVVRSDGEPLWVEGHVRATSSKEGPAGTVSVVREITDRRRLVEELSRKASTDPLTGLLNRRAFDEALATQIAGKGADHAAGCLAIFDLDHFKRINDRHGHAAGDIVLVAFARLLQQGCRPGDRVARLGGEEFAVLFDEVAPEQARVACDQIRLALMGERLWSPSGQQVFATVSVGVAALLAGDTAERALLAADAALYDAKEAGRNRLALAS